MRPVKILFVGDTHCNTRWWTNTVVATADAHDVDGIIQVGDFGWWPDGAGFIKATARSTRPVWFIDGNHESHPHLQRSAATARHTHQIDDPHAPVPLVGNVSYLPRGGRLVLGGVTIVGCGGAVSIDQDFRTAGVDWFLDEQITDADIDLVAAAGPADILVTHDAPSGYQIPGLGPRHELPIEWQHRLESCEAHRLRINEAIAHTGASTVIHGHYHSAYRRDVDVDGRHIDMIGLDCDGTRGAFAVATLDDGTISIDMLIGP